jgi:hypothetical protein
MIKDQVLRSRNHPTPESCGQFWIAVGPSHCALRESMGKF